MEWAQILVIILSVFLAIFLVLAIVLVTMLIRITKQIKSVTSSAQRAAESLEKTVVGATKTVSPLLLMRIISKYLVKKAKRRRREPGKKPTSGDGKE